jgi:hypothetical protein
MWKVDRTEAKAAVMAVRKTDHFLTSSAFSFVVKDAKTVARSAVSISVH